MHNSQINPVAADDEVWVSARLTVSHDRLQCLASPELIMLAAVLSGRRKILHSVSDLSERQASSAQDDLR